jgi:TolB-like protein/Flp pilus assembly protein TadD
MPRFKQLIAEIHRRSLWQVLGIYLAGSWVVLQAADTLTASLGLPDWVPRLSLVLLVILLPMVVATAFVQEGVPGRETDEGRANEGQPAGPEVRGEPSAGREPTGDTADATDGEAEGDGVPHRLFTWRNALLLATALLAAWGAAAAGWLLLGGPASPEGPSAGERPSLAVLPFEVRSTEEGSEFFVAGIHDDLLTQLSKLGGLKLISRTSVLRYRDSEKSVREIAEELGVAAVLEGGVQRAADRLKINVQLIDAETDDHLWAETYDRELTTRDLFEVQSDLARQIAAALQATLTPEENARLRRQPPQSLEAYDLYVEARYYWNRRTLGDTQRALDLFEEAIALDSTYALAYAGVADALMTSVSWGMATLEEVRRRTETSLERALELDPLLGEVHAARGNLLETLREWPEAEAEFLRALELAPGYATAHHWYALMLAKLGRFDEALSEIRRAAELDPLSPIIHTNVGWIHYFAGDYERAVDQLARVIEREPSFVYPRVLLADAYAELGRQTEAIESAEEAVSLDPLSNYELWLAYHYARAGRLDEAAEIVREVESRAQFSGDPTRFALVHLAAGNVDRAFEALGRAFDVASPFVNELKVDPRYDPLRADPRFAQLLARARLD